MSKYKKVSEEVKTRNQIKKMYDYKVNRLALRGKMPLTTFDKFYEQILNEKKYYAYQDKTLKEIAKSRLNSRGFTSYEEVVHKNIVDKLKKEGIYSTLYRKGGRTAFEASKYYDKKQSRDIDTRSYHSNGYYMMGTAKLIFWSSDDGSQDMYIEIIPMIGTSLLKRIKGDAI